MRFCPACHERYDDAAQFCPRDGEALPVDEADARIGTVLLGQFELLEVIGKGAMGTVYRAWQTGMERQVAVKILRPELVRDPKVVQRFDREARAVAKLSHPNIVTFFLVGETDDGLPFLAMEHVEGEPLEELLERERVLPVERAMHIALQITSALTEAHAEGIVHRDLKPANILLTQRRRMPDFVKVLDFGIAKILRGEGESREEIESRLTREGTIFGTPHYIAPEQASGSEIDHRADIYGLGVVLYRMLTGHLPFEGAGIAVLLAHIGQPPPRPRELAPDLDPRLEEIVLRAMAKEPAERFASAEEFGDALAPFAGAGDAMARRRPSTQGSAPVVPLASADLPVDVALLEAEPASRPSRSAPAPAAPTPSESMVAGASSLAPSLPRRRGGWGVLAGLLAIVGVAAAAFAFVNRPSPQLGAAGPDAGRAVVPPPVATTPPEPAPAPEPPSQADPAMPLPPTPEPDGETRVVTVGEDGYAIRARVPREPRLGIAYRLEFDVLDPTGKPLGEASLPASLEDADEHKVLLVATRTDPPGRFVLERTFETPGRYHLHLSPEPARPELHIWLDLVVRDAQGKLPELPVAAAPKERRRSPLASKGLEMVAPEPPPAPLDDSHEGAAYEDPYHGVVEDDPEPAPPPRATPPRPAPPKPRPKVPKVQPRPNPDGLE